MKSKTNASFLPDNSIRKNDEIEVEIVGIGIDGEGIGKYKGFTLFIPGTLPGERVLARVIKLKKHFGYAKSIRIIDKSNQRTEAPCPIFDSCGGCQLQHMTYEAQLAWKQQHVIDALERIGKFQVVFKEMHGIQDREQKQSYEKSSSLTYEQNKDASGIEMHPIIGMQYPWRYRNKAQVPIGERDGQLISGFYAKGTHDIIDMQSCLIQHEMNDRVVEVVKRISQEIGISAYQEATHQGILRHVLVKFGFSSHEVMIVVVTNSTKIPHAEQFVNAIRLALPNVVSICHNVNRQITNVILGEETHVLWGRGEIYDTIDGIRFAISAQSFFQVNPIQTEVLYRKVLEYAQLSGQETVIDAYCGIGTISLFLARHARNVYGVEIVEQAIVDAKRNAELNGMRNVVFEAGPAERVLPEWARQGIVPDVIVVDPPRKGCDAQLLQTMLALAPARIVYVSCNPATLARDLRILEDGGYRTVEVQPVDMFPQTTHVECVAWMSRV